MRAGMDSMVKALMVRACAAFVGVVCMAPCASAQPGGGPPPATVIVDSARMEVVEQWREVTGSLRTARRSVVAAEESGRVVELCCMEGDSVTGGQVMARLDDTLARIAVDSAEAAYLSRQAEVSEWEAEVERARLDLDRVERAAELRSANQREVDEARQSMAARLARLERAQAELSAAESARATARERFADMTIEAPFDGRIVRRMTESGQWVDAGGAVVEIVSLDEIEAWLDVPERYLARLLEGSQTVRVRIEALGEEVELPVTAVVPQADELSRLFPVRVALSNAEGRLRPGMSAVGLIPTGQSEPALTVAKDAMLRDDAGEFLYWNAGGVAAVARVERLFAVGDRVAVRAARLPPGAEVVIEGNERLFPGQPLIVQGGGGEGGGGRGGARSAQGG